MILQVLFFLGLVASGLGEESKRAITVAPLRFRQISLPFNQPIGIDYHAPTNNIITSVFFPSGNPYNFRRVDFDGVQSQFSTAGFLTNEIKITIVRDVPGVIFTPGDLFTGNGIDGQVTRLGDTGNTVITTWCDLKSKVVPPITTPVGLLRGSLHVDETGVWGYRLIIVTTNGYVFAVEPGTPQQCGNVELLAFVGNVHLEGLSTVPNNATRYGGLAGSIIIGNEQNKRLWVVKKNGNTTQATAYSTAAAIEDIDIIGSGENFFGIDNGQGKLLGAGADQFTNSDGAIVVAQEFPGILWELIWDSNLNAPVTVQIPVDPNSPEKPLQWEHVTFAPAGIREILPKDFSLCAVAEKITGGTTSSLGNVKEVLLGGAKTAVSNYAYNNFGGPSFASGATNPAPQSGTLLVYFTQDFQNTFSLTMVAKSDVAGALNVSFTQTGLGPNTVLQVFDDSVEPDGTDSLDRNLVQNSGASRQFFWRWGAGKTDGVVIAPLQIVTATKAFNIQISITGFQGLSSWKVISQTGEILVATGAELGTTTLVLRRVSCNCTTETVLTKLCCGNGIVEKFEQCDGGSCCNAQCAITCSESLCPTYSTCTECANNGNCGWCCGTKKCLSRTNATQCKPGNVTTDVGTCSVGCPQACVNGFCECGVCRCILGYQGAICNLKPDCTGVPKDPTSPDFQEFGPCGCKNDTSCIGCDGVPYPTGQKKMNDTCGVCGGDGSSCFDQCDFPSCETCVNHDGITCLWCVTTNKCEREDTSPCKKFKRNGNCDKIINLSPAQIAGISAGIIAAIVIAAIVGVVVIGGGSKVGYDYWVKNKQTVSEIKNNPLFEERKGMSGTSPLYEEKNV